MSHGTTGGIAFLAANPGQTASSIHPGGAFPAITIGPISIDPFPSGDCPPGQFRDPLFGTCIGLAVPDPTGFGPISPAACGPGFVQDAFGNCVPGAGIADPTPIGTTPGERNGVRADGPASPSRVARNVHVCPKFVDGSTGILYFSPLTNEIVCLPRSMTTKAAMAFGLLRKNKPRAKAPVTAADQRLLSKTTAIRNKIASLADKADALGCPKKKR